MRSKIPITPYNDTMVGNFVKYLRDFDAFVSILWYSIMVVVRRGGFIALVEMRVFFRICLR